MANAELSPSYVKYAFTDQHNLVLLFGAACFSAAFASRWPLAVGAAGEISWLMIGPRLPAFRKWVDARQSMQYLAHAEKSIQGALRELREDEVNRFVGLTRSAEELVLAARERKTIPLRDVQHGLLELRRTFLDYQFLGQRVVTLINATPTTDVEKEAARLQQEYAAERQLTLRMTLRKALTVSQMRLQQQQVLTTIQRTIELRLEMLEKAVPHLRGRLVDPSFSLLSQELDKALANVGSVETLELAVDKTFET